MTGKYALIIGNTEYTDPGLAQLTAPGKDVEDFARILNNKDICSFDDTKILLNQPEPVVREAIDEFFDQKKPDDLLLLYFSGHGVRDEVGALYLAVKNTNRFRLRSTAVKSDFIREAMDQSRSKRQVLILDCCNSGAFAQGTKAATGMSIGTSSAFEAGYGRIILTASDSTQFAWEGDKVIGETGNSLFTHYLVKGLEGEADRDGDGCITVDELYDYAYEKVKVATPKQTPSKFSSKQQGEIVLRQITRMEDIKSMSLPDELIEATEDSRTFVREGAVQQLEKLLKGKNLGLARSAREVLERLSMEDDSRRVAQAAAQALQNFSQPASGIADHAKQNFTEEGLRWEGPEPSERKEDGILIKPLPPVARVTDQQTEVKKPPTSFVIVKATQEQASGTRGNFVQPTENITQPGQNFDVHNGLSMVLSHRKKVVSITIGSLAVIGLVIVFAINSAQRAISMASAQSTNTAQAQATQTSSERKTETAVAKTSTSVAEAKATNTAIVRARKTAIANATMQARNQFVNSLTDSSQWVFGPKDGSLKHDDNDKLTSSYEANVNVRDFIVKATFINPYASATGSWDYGFMFRLEGSNKQYRLIISSNKDWTLENWSEGSSFSIKSGRLSDLNLMKGGSNEIVLYCQENKGILYVNDNFIADLGLSTRTNSGDILISTGMYQGDEVSGYSTDYTDFTIWKIP